MASQAEKRSKAHEIDVTTKRSRYWLVGNGVTRKWAKMITLIIDNVIGLKCARSARVDGTLRYVNWRISRTKATSLRPSAPVSLFRRKYALCKRGDHCPNQAADCRCHALGNRDPAVHQAATISWEFAQPAI